jgi:hypothetical protein
VEEQKKRKFNHQKTKANNYNNSLCYFFIFLISGKQQTKQKIEGKIFCI